MNVPKICKTQHKKFAKQEETKVVSQSDIATKSIIILI